MNRILAWDIPTRIFHWMFAGSLTAALGIAFLVDDESPLFRIHMLLGIVAVFMLVIRGVMGIVGSRYSKFSSYPVRPREVLDYMRTAVFSKTKLYAGNNPGSAMAAILMFLIVPALFASGVAYSGETFGELHEILAWSLLAVIALHLVGLAWHTLRHRENISLAMITGEKSGRSEDAIASCHPIWAGILLLASVVWIANLFAGYSASNFTVRLPATGISVPLGGGESHQNGNERGEE